MNGTPEYPGSEAVLGTMEAKAKKEQLGRMLNEILLLREEIKKLIPLRDFFAAAALMGMVLRLTNNTAYGDVLAEQAYQYADAMIKAREGE
jgi:hypothetical protein